MTLRRVLRSLPPADARLLRWVLAAALTGFACIATSMILVFAWAGTGTGGLLTASHWLTRGGYACAAVVWVCALLLWRRNRRRAKDDGSTRAPR
jgi:membrane protein implicated in regulation of membrane protease activity